MHCDEILCFEIKKGRNRMKNTKYHLFVKSIMEGREISRRHRPSANNTCNKYMDHLQKEILGNMAAFPWAVDQRPFVT